MPAHVPLVRAAVLCAVPTGRLRLELRYHALDIQRKRPAADGVPLWDLAFFLEYLATPRASSIQRSSSVCVHDYACMYGWQRREGAGLKGIGMRPRAGMNKTTRVSAMRHVR